jgi:hypothetical protein
MRRARRSPLEHPRANTDIQSDEGAMQGRAEEIDTAHGKQLGCTDAMRSTLARTCHDPWQLNHAICRPGPSEDVSNRGDRMTAMFKYICMQTIRCKLCTMLHTKAVRDVTHVEYGSHLHGLERRGGHEVR